MAKESKESTELKKVTRKRKVARYLLQKQQVDGKDASGESTEFRDVLLAPNGDAMPPFFVEAVDAKKWMRDKGMTGRFRIVRIIDEINAEEVVTKKIKLS